MNPCNLITEKNEANTIKGIFSVADIIPDINYTSILHNTWLCEL